MSAPDTWSATLRRIGRWADERDRRQFELGTDGDGDDARPPRPGLPATAWAVTRSAATVAGAPVVAPAMALAALRTARVARRRIDAFPEHLHALAEGRISPLRDERTRRLPAGERYLVTSDLHRCVAGRLDWPAAQRVKGLYPRVLERYLDDGWHLVENGDVEDFWMVGGSTWGAVYDLAGMLEQASGTLRPDAPAASLVEHLDRIVANNRRTYDVLSAFAAEGRYHRTMGNHDDAFARPEVEARLHDHLPGAEVVDTILLARDGSTPEEGIAGIDAVIAHGHLTDSWNGPGFALLGRLLTATLTTLGDLPTRGSRPDEGLPRGTDIERLMKGGWNRLITLDARYGGNRRFDSLDEQRLFARLAEVEPDDGWPWILHGHTHYPMLMPFDREGRPVRYANSGCGVLDGGFTALEWDPSDPERPVSLVVWTHGDGEPRRVELHPDGDRVRAAR